MCIFFKKITCGLCGLLLGGCALVSGDKPVAVSANDNVLIEQALRSISIDVPLVTHPIAGREIHNYVVSFDGTMNDRKRVPDGERETIVASIASRLGGDYYPGPGMQNPKYRNFIDGMFGYTSSEIAENAANKLLNKARIWLDSNRDGEIRILVAGFSRGAAIARNFMNIVDAATEKDSRLRNHVYFYALLYDTVSTGQFDSLKLSFPPSVDYAVHLVARDEPRFLFRPVVDAGPETLSKVFNVGGSPIPERINLLILPGAHSDIGGVYVQGVSYLYQQLTEQLLYQMGLIEQNCWERADKVIRAGKHDSRGPLDRIAGAAPPNSDATVARTFLSVSFPNQSAERVAENAARLREMSLANAERGAMIQIFQDVLSLPRLTLLRKGQLVTVLDWKPIEYIDGSSFSFSNIKNMRRITYHFLPPYEGKVSTILLSDPIWNRLPEGKPAVLSYSLLKHGPDEELVAFVDDVVASSIVGTMTSTPVTHHIRRKCDFDENGKLLNPVHMIDVETLNN